MTWRAAGLTALACTALCLAEIAASGRVETAGWKMFMGVLFERMHRGADNTVAALSLLMLGAISRIGDDRGGDGGGVAVAGAAATVTSADLRQSSLAVSRTASI